MGAMDQVRVGMWVVDCDGRGIGTVDAVKAGEPAPARPLRTWYITIDCDGLLGERVYVEADRIRDVVGGTVRLRVTADHLLEA